jgi:putative ABC transport system permease protein
VRLSAGTAILDGSGADLRQGLRSLARSPGLAAVAVLTLALGIGASTAVFSVLRAVVLHPLPFADQERLVVAWMKDVVAYSPWAELSYPDFRDWQSQSRSFSALAALPTLSYGQGYVMTGEGEAALVESTKVTGRFFPLLGVPAALGRVLDERDDRADAPKAVVLGHALWRDRFGGDPGVVGQSITLTGEPYTVVGVMPPAFEFPKGVDLWTAFVPTVSPETRENRGASFLQVVGRLRPGVSVREAAAELDTIIARVARAHPEMDAGGHRAVVTPLVHHLLGNARQGLWLLLAATGMLLAIGCVNVAGLLLARATGRRRELALRAALGAGRWRLARQLAAESTVLAVAAGALSVPLARVLMAVLLHIAPADIPRLADTRLDSGVLVFSVAVTLLTAVVFGLLPLVSVARPDLGDVLGEGSGRLAGDRSGKRFRGGLVAGEVAVAVVLVSGAALLLRSFLNLGAVDLGFVPANVLTMQLNPRGGAYGDPAARRAFFRELIERLESRPGVLSATAVLIRPLEGTVGWDATYAAEGQPEAEARKNAVANFEVVSPHYFRVFGIRLDAGRAFTEHDTLDAPGVVVLSRTLATRLFGSVPDALGKRVRLDFRDEGWRTVVGVAADARYRELQDVRLDIYVPLEQNPRAWINHFAVRTATDPRAFVATVRRELAALDPNQAMNGVLTMDEIVDGHKARPRFTAFLLLALSGLALVLAIVGIHAVVSYAAARRTGEMGVRLAVGADPRDIRRLVVREGMRPVVAGVAAGAGTAAVLARVVEGLLFGVSANDPATYAGAAVALAAAGWLACWIPAVRASKLDPLAALRHE